MARTLRTKIETKLKKPDETKQEWEYPCLMQAPCNAVFFMSGPRSGVCLLGSRNFHVGFISLTLGPYELGFTAFEGTVEIKGYLS